ncbi:MAG: biopolymer transporter ExbD [Desulfobacteraceae bacterium]|uniref:Biopolymer transporter ExbD n=1 Tax=Candidatus Desulfaltia bathyphila TaxID=2841697 RepID=A0A8J6TC50_9BACT|nr:biopolymer transporter ExbD [Candidatus Desulfaltia bathyphila]MBL7205070.1 biopolymer transporter ExbD [Desulfobacteraceae bacterium]
MLVHREKKSRYQIQMPLISLIDIIFLLLIYFLLTTNFMVDEGIKIKLPQAKTSAPQTEQEITIYVNREGRAFLENREVPLGNLFERLKEMIGGRKDKLVVIKADRSVILNKAVKVMDVAKAAGAGRLCLATEKEF